MRTHHLHDEVIGHRHLAELLELDASELFAFAETNGVPIVFDDVAVFPIELALALEAELERHSGNLSKAALSVDWDEHLASRAAEIASRH